jgi:hypothetical protein
LFLSLYGFNNLGRPHDCVYLWIPIREQRNQQEPVPQSVFSVAL